MNFLARLSLCLGMGCLCAVPMYADTFTTYTFSNGNDRNLAGIDKDGNVLIFDISLNQFEIYNDGMLTNTSVTRPDFTTDNGTPCASPIGASDGAYGLCNGDREVYTAGDTPSGIYEVYPGSDPLGDLIHNGLFDPVTLGTPYVPAALNAAGDFVYVDGHDEVFREIVVTSTPEPSSLLLLASGMGSVAGLVRQRRATTNALRG